MEPTAPALIGRTQERRTLDHLLANVRGGQSAVLVLRGEEGAGKTALLDHCARQATELHVVRLAGAEAEAGLPLAAVHQLCAPFADRFDALPAPQRSALAVALGSAAGEAPDRFLLALGVLGLLCSVAEDRPVLCLVDDAQWLDDASTQILGFVARRLLADRVALLFAVREPAVGSTLHGLPEMPVVGLEEIEARALLDVAIPGRLDEQVRDRVIAETGGNPRALLALRRGVGPAQLGPFHTPPEAALAGPDERDVLERIAGLPSDTQRLLLLAAAEPTGDVPLLWRAAAHAGLTLAALGPAQDTGLVRVVALVRFRSPAVRAAAYRRASAEARRDAHAALAAACDPVVDPDRRAWHGALATLSPDAAAADELERCAARAQARGGVAAGAAFLQRATELTPDAARRAARALAAAELELLAGAPATAGTLLRQAEAGPADPLLAGRAQATRGRLALVSGDERGAPGLLLAAARALEGLDPQRSRDALLDALAAGTGRPEDLAEVAREAAAGSAPARGSLGSACARELLLDALASVAIDGCAASAPALHRAVSAIRTQELPAEQQLRRLGPATRVAQGLWDDGAWEELGDRHVALARETGALGILPTALTARIDLHLAAGELAAAAALVDEAAAVGEATRSGLTPPGALAVAAHRGREAGAMELVEAVGAEAAARGDALGCARVAHAEAVLLLGLGRYREACAAAQRGAARPEQLGPARWCLPLLVEAAVRSDQPALAREALERLATCTRASGTPWALGVEACARALAGEGDEAERSYQEAVALLAETRLAGEHARARLLYGEWLRRRGRRIDARIELRAAHGALAEMGMEAYAERARRELVGTGERMRTRGAEARDELTPQERQIAQLARAGLSNSEIGARLFLSPRTVEWHMNKVFRKLGIHSRTALHDALPDRPMATA